MGSTIKSFPQKLLFAFWQFGGLVGHKIKGFLDYFKVFFSCLRFIGAPFSALKFTLGIFLALKDNKWARQSRLQYKVWSYFSIWVDNFANFWSKKVVLSILSKLLWSGLASICTRLLDWKGLHLILILVWSLVNLLENRDSQVRFNPMRGPFWPVTRKKRFFQGVSEVVNGFVYELLGQYYRRYYTQF